MSMRKKQASFIDQVRRAVEESDMSRYAIGKITGIDQAALSRFVYGERGLTMENLDRLAECLGLRVVIDKPKTKGRE